MNEAIYGRQTMTSNEFHVLVNLVVRLLVMLGSRRPAGADLERLTDCLRPLFDVEPTDNKRDS